MKSSLRVIVLSLMLAVLPGVLDVSAAPVAAVAEVQLRQVDRILSADAVIESVSQANVAAQLSARVLSVVADAGQLVHKGQVLARLDTRETAAVVAAAAAQVAQAESRLVEAQQQWERAKSLKEKNFVSQAALDSAKAALGSAEAAVQAARSGRTLAIVAQSHAEIVAPIDGVISARHIEPGDLAQPGRTVFVIYKPGALRAVATIPQSHAAGLAGAQVAGVDVSAIGKTLVAGKVTVLPAAEARALSQRVRVDLPQPLQAVPGMAAKVQLMMGRVERLVVPQAAVVWRGEMSGVKVMQADGRALLRQVRLGETFAGDWVEVLSGLSSGERVQLALAR